MFFQAYIVSLVPDIALKKTLAPLLRETIGRRIAKYVMEIHSQLYTCMSDLY